MKATPAHPEPNPGYPDAKEFVQQHKAMLGAMLLGTGLVLGGCGWIADKTGGTQPPSKSDPNEVRLKGKSPVVPKITTPPSGENSPRLLGEIPVEPKIEQPTLGGVPPVVPQPEKSRD